MPALEYSTADMFDEERFADLDVLDCLEMFGSASKTASLLGLSQSSCSRRYRSLSSFLDLGFDRVAGRYASRRNHDVLAALRQVAQKLRTRRQLLRFATGWQFPDQSCSTTWRRFSVPSMSCSEVLNLLDNRLLDVWFGGLYECQNLIGESIHHLDAQRLALGQQIMALPLLRTRLMLLAHRNHPLVGRRNLTPDDLVLFPSPALPMGAAPLLNSHLHEHGLATSPYGSTDYDPGRWEAVASDGHTLVYAPEHRLQELESQFQLVPLCYELGLADVGAVVGHRDVLMDPSFKVGMQQLQLHLKASAWASCPGLEWLV